MTDAVFELPAATFDLPLALSGGTQTTLRDYAGKWLVLYFYPKDSTPGCTTEGLTSTPCCRSSKKQVRWCWASRAIR